MDLLAKYDGEGRCNAINFVDYDDDTCSSEFKENLKLMATSNSWTVERDGWNFKIKRHKGCLKKDNCDILRHCVTWVPVFWGIFLLRTMAFQTRAT